MSKIKMREIDRLIKEAIDNLKKLIEKELQKP